MNNYNYIVCSGGGTKGLMYLGAIQALEDKFGSNYLKENIKGFAGTSAGALTALALMLRLNVSDIKDIVSPLFGALKNVVPRPDISLLVGSYGLDKGEELRKTVKYILRKAGLSDETTFADLNRLLRTKFICCTTNLNRRKIVYLSFETTPSLKICDAVFMSMCVPLLFAPVEYMNELYVDGALIENIPLCFPSNETLYFNVTSEYGEIKSWSSYIDAVFTCGLELQTESFHAYNNCSNNNIINLMLFKSIKLDSTISLNLHLGLINQIILSGYFSTILFLYPEIIDILEKIVEMLVLNYIDNLHSFEVDEHYNLEL